MSLRRSLLNLQKSGMNEVKALLKNADCESGLSSLSTAKF